MLVSVVINCLNVIEWSMKNKVWKVWPGCADWEWYLVFVQSELFCDFLNGSSRPLRWITALLTSCWFMYTTSCLISPNRSHGRGSNVYFIVLWFFYFSWWIFRTEVYWCARNIWFKRKNLAQNPFLLGPLKEWIVDFILTGFEMKW